MLARGGPAQRRRLPARTWLSTNISLPAGTGIRRHCDLQHHSVFDVVLGRSEAALEKYLQQLPGKRPGACGMYEPGRPLPSTGKKHFPKAKIVADRFHVIRLVNHHFLAQTQWPSGDRKPQCGSFLMRIAPATSERIQLEKLLVKRARKTRLQFYLQCTTPMVKIRLYVIGLNGRAAGI